MWQKKKVRPHTLRPVKTTGGQLWNPPNLKAVDAAGVLPLSSLVVFLKSWDLVNSVAYCVFRRRTRSPHTRTFQFPDLLVDRRPEKEIQTWELRAMHIAKRNSEEYRQIYEHVHEEVKKIQIRSKWVNGHYRIHIAWKMR